MTVEGLVNGLEVNILFDTGSQIDIMSEKCYQKLLVKPKPNNSTCSDIIGITGKKGKIKGKFNTSVRIGEFEATTELNIVPNCMYDVILGKKFIEKMSSPLI